jgi:hypothetical protein
VATLAPVNNDSVLHCELDPSGWHRKVEIGVVTRWDEKVDPRSRMALS